MLYPGFCEFAGYFQGTKDRVICGSWSPAVLPDFGKASRFRRVMSRAIFLLSERLAGRWGSYLWEPEKTEPSASGEYDLAGATFSLLRSKHRLLFVRAWGLRDWAALQKHQEHLRRYFALAQEHGQRVEAVANRMRQKEGVVVGVHVRRGDYATFAEGRYFFDHQDYRRAMKGIQHSLRNNGKAVRFLLCGNEPGVADLPVWEGLEVNGGTGHPVEDLYALARCDYLLGPPSTFSMWASFYGRVPLGTMTSENRAGAELTLEQMKIYGLPG